MTSKQQESRPILISGGGIGGFAAALALSKAGFKVRLFEKAQEIREIGAGIQIGPNAFHVFERLGVTAAVRAKAAMPERLVMMDGISGEQVVSIPLDDQFVRRFKHPYALIHRADLHRILLDACVRSSRIEVSTNTTVIGFTDNGDGVTLHTTEGDISGHALIGADGLWSTIRDQIVGDGSPRVSGHIAYRAVLPISEVPDELRSNTMTLWAGAKTHLVHYPLRGGDLFNLVAVFHSDRYVEGWDAVGDAQELHLRFRDAVPTVKALLAKIDTWRMWVLCDRDPIRNWSKGNVTLLGDAAHPMLQYMAQGACMAMEDAVVLADELACESSDVPAAFLRYQDRRYLRTGKVQMSARLYGEFYHASEVKRELRNQFLQARSLEQTLDGMAWLYDPTPIQPISTESDQGVVASS
ncbi:3-hydroxybenzoate 6-monooxygenase [Burkholderia gladioli pv. gladioli]|uniref:3-hydroxybenzoate 6-hydroxylase n=1 Tax=Burkholderia gladioli TaxID=28095 RepID=A0A095G1B9_BURGA|nr:3-hydroxybenzoate 6-monooxygenase [Burkholderia gladioli]AJW99456.1 3-hydroxybenzoate 6-hydroxylase [Burkholderia gladioli]ASD79968.1 salicylate hydroxylase [Burkholderia gladioli pv. gladioli]AWY54786.1 salicylate hydroxylase [Burkholderia gladioli pv. gladioli]KGC11172.1 3-hydroxybenzoate 6-hydroxylase [Burkholderia gladioli]MDJ1164226.1 3-hydroxybenzoate 6-monooxygenase [Burkholderia gladioli pv. gladioli]